MVKLAGMVLDRESGTGIERLQVRAMREGAPKTWISFGSDVTDADGAFSIQAPTPSEADGAPVKVRLTVLAPERDGAAAKELHNTEARLVSAGAHERVVIEISGKAQEKLEVKPRRFSLSGVTVAETIRAGAAEAALVEEGWREVAHQRVSAERARREVFEDRVKARLMEDISTVPAELAKPERMALEGDPDRSVRALTRAALADGAQNIADTTGNVDGTLRRTRYFLTDTQRDRLDELLANAGGDEIGRAALEEVLRLGEDSADAARPVEVIREEGEFDRFLEETFDERCARELLDGGAQGDDDDSDDGSDDSAPKAEIDEIVGRIVADTDAPAAVLAGRPGQDDVIGNIREFALSPGPADTPALFDFHQLNIAFEHVWKEFLDDRIEPLARASFMALSGQGGDADAIAAGERPVVAALAAEAELVAGAGVGDVPKALFAQRLPSGLSNDHLGIGGIGEIGPGFDPIPPIDPPPLPDPPGGGFDLGDVFGQAVLETGVVVAEPRPLSLIAKLRAILRSRYAFTAFGADRKHNGINFGITVTYRQRWEPVTYQVGELIRTITLAPGEKTTYSKTMKVTRKRAEKEIEKNISIRKDEFSETNRAEAEIIRKAEAKTNFSLSTEGTYNFGVASGDSNTTTQHDAQDASNDTKKSFREAVMKAAQEYRQERVLEISTEEEISEELKETGEISNPNDELTVTYLFFELQRRFRVSERIHAATPVVLVAQDLPKPNEIDEAFLIRHGWILRRTLLDDRYAQVLDYVAGPLAGDKVARDALYRAMNDHRAVVTKLRDDLHAMKEQASEGYEALRRAVEARIREVEDEDTDGLFSDIGDFFGGGGQSPEAARMREEAAKNHEERAVEQVKQLTMALQREISAYAEATEKYTKAHRAFREWELRIVDMLLHIKENILHYMQAIWANEHPDQRFLRLHMKEAPVFGEQDGGATWRFLGTLPLTRESVAPDGTVLTRRAVEFEYTPRFELADSTKTLAEICDLDRLMGFKGNYLIFPLRESNPLTDYMIEPYVDAGFRLLDPDEKGNISREDFARYICDLRARLTDAEFEALRPALTERFEKLLKSAPVHGDEIIVPTGSAYIEALPGANALLEDFKLAHRALDVVTAQEEARMAALDAVRRAKRILEGELGDPDFDAQYLFSGETGGVVAPPPGGGDRGGGTGDPGGGG